MLGCGAANGPEAEEESEEGIPQGQMSVVDTK